MAGVIIGNRYELMEKIGSGGMAIVYKARCRLLNRYVAVKMLRPEFNDDIEFLKRFETEAQAAAALSHPNIVSVYDVGTHDKIHYIVMEYVEGVTLKEFLSDTGPLPIEKIVDFSTQIASALEHAHAKKIIHHDIKPHNIIITESGLLKVTDFGLARAVSASTTVASAGAIGSVHYASPEQARGGYTDAKSDIYSLGITMYEMTTGRVPFDGDTPVSVAIKHLQKEPTPPSEIAPDVPQSLEKIILKCIEKEPSKRYQQAGEIIGDLKMVLNNDGVVYKNEGDEEKFSTKRLPTPEELKKEEAKHAGDKKPKSREDIISIPEPDDDAVSDGKKKRKKEDVIATVAAIATTLLIAAILGIILWNAFGTGTIGKPKIKAPDILGITVEEATELAEEQGLTVTVDGYEYSDDIEEGKIISQTPTEGEKIKEGGEIKVVVSRGTEKSVLPTYKGMSLDNVKADLDKLKIKYKIEEVEDEEVQEGYVIKTEPDAGSEIKPDTEVKIFVSKGKDKEEIRVPSLIGMTVDGAHGILENKKLSVGNVTYRESEQPKGTIIQQSPVLGSKTVEGASVDIVVSSGEAATPTPEPEPTQTPEPKPTEEPETEEPEQTPDLEANAE